MAVFGDRKGPLNATLGRARSAAGRARRGYRRAFDRIGPSLQNIALRTRSRHIFVVDVIGLTIGALIALELWRAAAPGVPAIGTYLWAVGIIVAARTAVDIIMGLYRHSYRHASVADMGLIIACAAVGSVVAAIIVLGAYVVDASVAVAPVSAAFWVLEASLAVVVLASTRFLIRVLSDLQPLSSVAVGKRASRSLLYGAGWAGVTVARSTQRGGDQSVVPVGFLDDDLDLRGRKVAGLPVFGDIQSIGRAVRQTKAKSLLITMPRATGDAVRRVFEAGRSHGLDVRRVPPVTDLLDGSLDASRIRQIRVEDLLGRPPSSAHTPATRELFHRADVLITGAAGSIGSELARQVLALEPRSIVLVDRAESALYLVGRDLLSWIESHRHHDGSEPTIGTHLLDVADRDGVRRLLADVRPTVVLHAAAYKHVPVLEDHPSPAVRTNIGGTASVVEAAADVGVERLVLVSTDKAVWPSSVMGATKRVAEMIVADAARDTGRHYAAVRFGNVLGSTGSVVPIFQSQLEKGEPLTITDPDATRYFMTIPEACWLILDAAALADSGDMFVLDMGDPVRIMDIARDVARLAGRDPDSVPMKVIGLRRGEKLHEELFYRREQVRTTEVSKVLRARPAPPPSDVRASAERLVELADGRQDVELVDRLHRLVRDSVSVEEEAWTRTDGDERGDRGREVVAIPIDDGSSRPLVHQARADGNRVA